MHYQPAVRTGTRAHGGRRRRIARPPVRVIVAAGLALFASAAHCQAPLSGHAVADEAHAALAEDPALGLATVIDAAMATYPASVELGARASEAGAWQTRGDSLIAGRPQLSFRYQTDRWGDDFGLQEYESGIQLPLWKWGQRKAVRQLGSSLDGASEALSDALRWEVAGALRATLWSLALARGERDIAEQSLDIASRLTGVVERRYELGDVALADLLLARTTGLAAATELTDATAAVVDARRQYRSLTALDRRPVFRAEELSELTEVPVSHPSLQFATAEVERRRAAEEVVRRSALTAPTLTVGPRRERSVYGQAYEDSIGITVTVPFGGGSHVATEIAAAVRATASATAELRRLLRQLELNLHEAAHGLEVIDSNIEDTRRRLDIAEESYRMGETAYANGEIGLTELLNLQRVLLGARRDTLRLDVERKRLISFYNQSVGDVP